MWPCSPREWANDICGDDYDGLAFSTIVTKRNRAFWIISMVILAFSLTSDSCDHLMHMRIFKFPWKILLMGQVLVSMSICVVNASLTAGSDSVVDILMNAVGLLILNDLDNIVGKLYVFMAGLEDEETLETCEGTDRIFSLSFALPHIIWVAFYSFWFLGIYQVSHPPSMFTAIMLIQTVIYPILLIIWYIICFADCLNPCRQSFCLKYVFAADHGNEDGHGDDKKEG